MWITYNVVCIITHQGLENVGTFSSRPRPRRLFQDQNQDHFSSPRGASRPRPRSRDYISGWYIIYTILGALAHHNGILPCTTFTLRQVLRSPILAALLHDTRAVCVSQTLRNVTRKGIRKSWSSGICATSYCARLGSHHVEHRPTFYILQRWFPFLWPPYGIGQAVIIFTL